MPDGCSKRCVVWLTKTSRSDFSLTDLVSPSQVFKEDIERLLRMKEMWTVPGRVKPTPLDYDTIMDGTFVLPASRQATAALATGSVLATEKAKEQSGLKDQQDLTLKENLLLFTSRYVLSLPGDSSGRLS